MGYRPDLPDQRDYFYAASIPQETPPKADMRQHMPPIYNQGTLGCCVAHAVVAMCQYNQIFQKKSWLWTSSRLFQYFNTRRLMGTTAYDSGSGVRDGIKAAADFGIVDEVKWPYDIPKFTEPPPGPVYTEASRHLVKRYERVPSLLPQMKNIIARHHPIAAGLMLYTTAYAQDVLRTGDIPMPPLKDTPWGGHCVVLCGYDDASARFIFRNSWGTGWGASGYGTLPYEYAINQGLCGDLWTIRSVK